MQTMIEWVWRDPCWDLLMSWSQKGSRVYQNQFGVNQTLATHCRTNFGWLGDSTTPNLTLRKTTNLELLIELHWPAKFHGYLWMSWASKAEVFTDQAHTRDSDHQAESRNFWKKKSIRIIFHESFDTTSGTRLPKVLAIQKITNHPNHQPNST